MAEKVVLVDTSVLIEFFRKSDKSNSRLIALVRQDYAFSISSVTAYEIYSGATAAQNNFWQLLLEKSEVLAFDKEIVKTAVDINSALKLKRKQIAIADLFIAATAVYHNLPLATLNMKHFDRIEQLHIIE